MSLTVEQAYSQIKNLEKTGQVTLPQPKDTVDVGSIDLSTGAFTWNVPTFVKTIVIPPHPPVKTNTIRQPLPSPFGMPGRFEVTADVRNLLAQGYLPMGGDGRKLLIVEAPRIIRGGVNFTF